MRVQRKPLFTELLVNAVWQSLSGAGQVVFARMVSRQARTGLALASLAFLAACGHHAAHMDAKECMARVMYFESNRSSDDGMLAVGTVVMNRAQSGRYPKSICGVVGQKGQFAPGVLSRPMTERASRARAERMASAVIRGARHRTVGSAMFFHTAGYNYPYSNMNYKVVAGGNAFYEKRSLQPGMRNTTQYEVAMRQPSGGGQFQDDSSDDDTVPVVVAQAPAPAYRTTRPNRATVFEQAQPMTQVALDVDAVPAPASLPPIAWGPTPGVPTATAGSSPDGIAGLIAMTGG